MPIAPIVEIIAEIKAGRMVVLVDEEDRENEGDLVLRRRLRHAGGDQLHGAVRPRPRLHAAHRGARAGSSNLAPMTPREPLGARHQLHRVDRGGARRHHRHLGRRPRAHDARRGARRDAKPDDIVQPGHVFPLMAQPGGVLVRAGHTEAGCDLARLAGLTPAAVICEIMKDDGTMARLPDLESSRASTA